MVKEREPTQEDFNNLQKAVEALTSQGRNSVYAQVALGIEQGIKQGLVTGKFTESIKGLSTDISKNVSRNKPISVAPPEVAPIKVPSPEVEQGIVTVPTPDVQQEVVKVPSPKIESEKPVTPRTRKEQSSLLSNIAIDVLTKLNKSIESLIPSLTSLEKVTISIDQLTQSLKGQALSVPTKEKITRRKKEDLLVPLEPVQAQNLIPPTQQPIAIPKQEERVAPQSPKIEPLSFKLPKIEPETISLGLPKQNPVATLPLPQNESLSFIDKFSLAVEEAAKALNLFREEIPLGEIPEKTEVAPSLTIPYNQILRKAQTPDMTDLLDQAVKSSLGTQGISDEIKTSVVSKRPELLDDNTVRALLKLTTSIESLVPKDKRVDQVSLNPEVFKQLIDEMKSGQNLPQLGAILKEVLSGQRLDFPKLEINPDVNTPRQIPVEGTVDQTNSLREELNFLAAFLESFKENFVDFKVIQPEIPKSIVPEVPKPAQEEDKGNKFLEAIANNDCCELLLEALYEILGQLISMAGLGGGGKKGPPDNKNTGGDEGKQGGDLLQPLASKIESVIKSLIEPLDSLQRTLLGFGTDVGKFQQFLGDSINGLKGDSIQNLRNAAELYGKGFRENNRQLLIVANRMDLTNQNSKVLLTEIPRLAIAFRLGSDSMNDLGFTINQSAEKYGVSTEKLIEQLAKSKAAETAGQLGFGAEFGKNLTALQAKFPQAADKLREFTDAITSGGKEYQMLIAAGAGDMIREFEQAAMGSDPQAFEDATMKLLEAMSNMDGQFVNMAEQIGNGGQSMIFTFNKIKEDFGTGGVVATDALRAIGNSKKSVDQSAEQNKRYEDSLKAAVSALKTSFLPVVIQLVEILKPFFGILKFIVSIPLVTWGLAFIALRGVLVSAAAAVTAFTRSLQTSGGRQGGGGFVGMMGGPWGIALTAGVALAGLALAKSEDYLKSTSESTSKQLNAQKETNSILNNKGQEESKRTARMQESIYKQINRDLMFAVMSLKTDSSDQTTRDQVEELRNINKTLTQIKAGDSSVPARSRRP
jgi:hypothetical protein